MVNIEPTAEELAEIACLAADTARVFDIEPRVAMLSFSSFGSVRHPLAERVAEAVDLVRQQRPELVVDGEMHLDTAVVEEIVREHYPHSRIKGDANVLVFPNLAAGNIGYKLVQRLGQAETIGPILMGMRHPVSVLQHGDDGGRHRQPGGHHRGHRGPVAGDGAGAGAGRSRLSRMKKPRN